MSKTLNEALESIASEAISTNDVSNVSNASNDSSLLGYLNGDQLGALEKKYAALPVEIQQAMRSTYPSVSSPVELYILRQLRREANSFLASKLRTGWIAQLVMFVPDLTNGNDATRKAAEHRVASLADEIADIKEMSKTLKAVKVRLDYSSSTPAMAKACVIFGLNPQVIA